MLIYKRMGWEIFRYMEKKYVHILNLINIGPIVHGEKYR